MDWKQQKFNFIKNMNQQQQSLVKLGPKGNNPTKYEAAAAKFVFPAKDEACCLLVALCRLCTCCLLACMN